VVIADDSLVAREMLSTILSSDPEIEVVGVASNGEEVVDLVQRLRPDLVTMDIHMPKMDGLQATERIMAFHPTPILVVSSSVHGEGMGLAFDALNLGALEVIKKPEPSDWADLERIGKDVLRKVKILSRVKVITHIRGRRDRSGVPLPEPTVAETGKVSLVASGSSTGGPSALLSILERLPKDFPLPVVIAQHIADGFVPGLVSWLAAACDVKVLEAEKGVLPLPGHVYIAPTGQNMVLEGKRIGFAEPSAGQLYIPSADSLFESVARAYRDRAIGVILTGMGADGASGLKRMHDLGARTIAQDEETCTVFGMPKAAIDLGAADFILPVNEIGGALLEITS
jgi:two-component system chemotaxis response regulator CheB